MSLILRTIAQCDSCDTSRQIWTAYPGTGTPTNPTTAVVMRDLRRSYGWSVSRPDRVAYMLTCPDCKERRVGAKVERVEPFVPTPEPVLTDVEIFVRGTNTMTAGNPQVDHYWLTPRGWRYSGYTEQPAMTCIGYGGRGCPVTIRSDKPGGRCEFCARTREIDQGRAPVP